MKFKDLDHGIKFRFVDWIDGEWIKVDDFSYALTYKKLFIYKVSNTNIGVKISFSKFDKIENKPYDEQLKLIYMWVKTHHINLKEFKKTIGKIMRVKSNEV